LVGAIANYTSIISGKDNTIVNKDSQISSLNKTISTKNSQISDLQSQVNTLQAQISSLNSRVNDLTAEISNLQSQVKKLQAAQLQQVNVKWTDNHPLFGSAYVYLSGTIFNSGTNTASNVVITVEIYDSSNKLLGSGTISLGTISGNSYKNFEQGFNYGGGTASYVLTSISVT